MKVLILAAAEAESAASDGYPVCLADVDGMPLLQRLVEQISTLQPEEVIFVFRQADIGRFHLDKVAQQLCPQATIIAVGQPTAGAACSALLASSHIDNADELFIVGANEMIEERFDLLVHSFRTRNLDAGIVTFESVHPRYSYVRLDAEGHVIEAAEKSPISRTATAGIYWYSQGRHFVDAAKRMIRKNASVDGAFYICPAFNEMILKHQAVGVYGMGAGSYRPMKPLTRGVA